MLSVSIATVKFKFRSSCEWTLYFLKQLFSHHLYDRSFLYEHEIEIVNVEHAFAFDGKNESFSWQGTLSDGTQVCLTRQNSDHIRLFVGEQARITIDTRTHFTKCEIAEKISGEGLAKRPQPGGYILPLIQVILSSYKLYVLHASAVAFQRGAMLLLGPSGIGKTTMSLALCHYGMNFMGDDLVIIEKRSNAFMCHSLLFKPKIKDSVSNSKRTIDYIKQHNIDFSENAIIKGICYLQRDNAYHFHRETPQVKSRWLLEQGNDLKLLWYPHDWFDTASELASQVPGWIWHIGQVNELEPETIMEKLK